MYTIDNYTINTPIIEILYKIRAETSTNNDIYLKDIQNKHYVAMVTCPFHKNHNENKPGCGVFLTTHGSFKPGDFHCFVCNARGNLLDLISKCFNIDNNDSKKWLINNYGELSYNRTLYNIEDKIPFNIKPKLNKLNINLNQYENYHPYMTQRHLTKEVCEKFQIKYDPQTENIIFPIWDEHNNLVMLTQRNVNNKKFNITKNVKKPVYLYNYILNNNIRHVYVTESQINCLTLWGYNIPTIGLIGTGNEYQYNILNKSNIISYTLALDGDTGGWKGIYRFIQNINKSAIINIVELPEGKDVNDLTETEFKNLPVLDKWEWLKKYKNIINK